MDPSSFAFDKASLMKSLLPQPPVQTELSSPGDREQVLIIDGMVGVQCLKKSHETKKLVHLKKQFIGRVKQKANRGDYSEIRICFDDYFSRNVFKDQMRNKRTGDDHRDGEGFDFYDDMCIKRTPIADMLKADMSKHKLTEYFALGLLDEYKGNAQVKVIVSYHGHMYINEPHNLEPEFTSHDHPEVDTQIPLHVIHTLTENSHKHIDIYSVDTDVTTLMVDLVARNLAGPTTNIITHAGKARAPKRIDIVKQVETIGEEKSQALLGFYDFTGNDYGHKWVGVTKERWSNRFFSLPSNHCILKAFSSLGTLTSEECTLTADGNLHEKIKPLEEFVCMVYDKDGPKSLPSVRWKLYSKKNKELENLPPTRAALVPLIQRTNHFSRIHKSYTHTHPDIPPTTENGWTKEDGTDTLQPVLCLSPPAPKSILKLVKCGCKVGDCSSKQCSCHREGLTCTSLCTCSDNCSNGHC